MNLTIQQPTRSVLCENRVFLADMLIAKEAA
jgi:hypothetical protein